ncbi:unnamed protein product, partial [Lampetra fluviatilis]
ARQKFLLRRRGEAKTPLAFRSSLLALGRAAYLNMDCAALNSLALECLLSLARELGVVLEIAEEADISSLKLVQGIQAHLDLASGLVWRCSSPGVAVCATPGLERRRTRIILPPSLHATNAGESPGAAGWSSDGGQGLLSRRG